jgi:Bacterial Ig domain
MNMKLKQYWKTIGLLAVTLAVSKGVQAQDFDTNLPVVTIFAPDPTALEGTSSGAVTLTRNGSTSNALTVDLAISGSASNGVDYTQISNVVVIPAGFLAVDIPVNPIIDNVNRGNKSVVLTVETNAAYNVFRRHAVVEIIDDTFDIPKPTVTLVSPTNGSVYGFPTNITLLATATDPDVSITSVSFYANDDFLGKVTNSPYTLTWTNARPGHIAIFARAVDQVDQSTFSAPAHITVTNSGPNPFPFPGHDGR